MHTHTEADLVFSLVDTGRGFGYRLRECMAEAGQWHCWCREEARRGSRRRRRSRRRLTRRARARASGSEVGYACQASWTFKRLNGPREGISTGLGPGQRCRRPLWLGFKTPFQDPPAGANESPPATRSHAQPHAYVTCAMHLHAPAE